MRMVLDHQADRPSQWAAICSIASKIGCTAETLRKWVRREERDAGVRAGPVSAGVTGTVAVAGSIQNSHTLNVEWTLCYDEEDEGRCVLTAKPDNREVTDACSVAP